MSYKQELTRAIHGGDINTIQRYISPKTNGYRKSYALRNAVEGGQVKVVKYLLDVGADMGSRDPNGKTVMYYAQKKGRDDVIQVLLEHGAVIDTRSMEMMAHKAHNDYDQLRHVLVQGEPAAPNMAPVVEKLLSKAMAKDDREFVKCLVERHHVRLNKPAGKAGDSHLMVAVRTSSLSVVQYLLSRGADVNFVTTDGYTAMDVAIVRGELDTVDTLVEHGLNVNRVKEDGRSYSQVAHDHAKFDIEEYLSSRQEYHVIKKNRARKEKEGGGSSWASSEMSSTLTTTSRQTNNSQVSNTSSNINNNNNNEKKKKKLKNKVNDVNGNHKHRSKPSSPSSVEFYAIGRKDSAPPAEVGGDDRQAVLDEIRPTRSAKSALTRGKDKGLLRAAARGDLKKVKELIEERQVDINICNKKGVGALHEAAINGRLQVVTYLVQNGVLIDAFTEEGDTSLTLATESNQQSVVQYLLDSGASTDQINSDGFTALELAALGGDVQLVAVLLDGGADPNSPPLNADEQTALHCAVLNANLASVQLLVSRGADTAEVNASNETPLATALRLNHRDIADYLGDHYKPETAAEKQARQLRRSMTLRSMKSFDGSQSAMARRSGVLTGGPGGRSDGGTDGGTAPPLRRGASSRYERFMQSAHPHRSAKKSGSNSAKSYYDEFGNMYFGEADKEGQGGGGGCGQSLSKVGQCFCFSVSCFRGVRP